MVLVLREHGLSRRNGRLLLKTVWLVLAGLLVVLIFRQLNRPRMTGCRYLRTDGFRVVVEPDRRPSFELTADAPFQLEFGRGSSWHGLETIRIDDTGVRVQRFARPPAAFLFEATTLQLATAQRAAVVDCVNRHRLLDMGKSYSCPDIADGTQWALLVRQGPGEKSIYFNNSFPTQITAFAGELDQLLAVAGLTNAIWLPVPDRQSQEAAAQLSSSIDPRSQTSSSTQP